MDYKLEEFIHPLDNETNQKRTDLLTEAKLTIMWRQTVYLRVLGHVHVCVFGRKMILIQGHCQAMEEVITFTVGSELICVSTHKDQ